jgi:hypothetical protein
MTDEQIGKHKGAVETLMHEKKELSRLLQIVNSQLQRHLSALEEQGIDAEQYVNQLQEDGQQEQSRDSSSGRSSRSGSSSRRSRSRDSSRGRSRDSSGSSGSEDTGDRDFNPL